MRLFRYYTTALTLSSLLTGLFSTAQQVLPRSYSPDSLVNFIRTWDAVRPVSNAADFTVSTSVQTARMTTQYVDGLGRPLQTVLKQGSLLTGGTAADLVTAQVYDPYGRERYQYLPFVANTTGGNASLNDGLFKLNPFQQDSAFSKVQYPGETWFYGQTNFENSPLSRPLEVFAPGNSWVGRLWRKPGGQPPLCKNQILAQQNGRQCAHLECDECKRQLWQLCQLRHIWCRTIAKNRDGRRAW